LTPAENHVNQAKRNFKFLESINSTVNDCLDWQVTVCFYTALHLVNAHLADFGMKYITHHDVNEAINPVNALSATKISTDAYAAYKALSNLSRRSRYLVTIKGDKVDTTAPAAMTYDKHQARAFRHLSDILKFYSETYDVEIVPISVRCAELRQSEDLPYYKLIS
jgi:hypothetical protein